MSKTARVPASRRPPSLRHLINAYRDSDGPLLQRAKEALAVADEHEFENSEQALRRLVESILGVEDCDVDREMFAYSTPTPYYKIGTEIDRLKFGLSRDDKRDRDDLQLHVWDCKNYDAALGTPVHDIADVARAVRKRDHGLYQSVWGDLCKACERKAKA